MSSNNWTESYHATPVVPFSSPEHFSVFYLITLVLQHIYGMADFLIVVFSGRQRFSGNKNRNSLYVTFPALGGLSTYKETGSFS